MTSSMFEAGIRPRRLSVFAVKLRMLRAPTRCASTKALITRSRQERGAVAHTLQVPMIKA